MEERFTSEELSVLIEMTGLAIDSIHELRFDEQQALRKEWIPVLEKLQRMRIRAIEQDRSG